MRHYLRSANQNFLFSDDSYRLNIDPKGLKIQITGPTCRGVFYGIQTLLSLLGQSETGRKIPQAAILDWPRFEYRGFMIDVARNFFDHSTIKRLITAMSMHKINVLHLHLTDNEGWRLQIPGLEELTQVK